MNKTALLSLTLIIAGLFHPIKAFDWDLAIKTASFSAIVPTICALTKAPKNRMIMRKLAATCIGISSVTCVYYSVLLSRSPQVSDQFLSFISAGLAGGFGGYACAEAQSIYHEYQNEKAWTKDGGAIGSRALHFN